MFYSNVNKDGKKKYNQKPLERKWTGPTDKICKLQLMTFSNAVKWFNKIGCVILLFI